MRRLAVLVGAAIALPLTAAPGASQTPTADQVRDRLDAYLRSYEPQLNSLVATETLRQEIEPVYRRSTRIGPGQSRRLLSEVAFVGLPGEAGLMGFRRVVRVDDKPVDAPGGSMAELMRTRPPDVVSRQLLEQGARHNLGPQRSTNMPSLPLELLHPRYRARFVHTLEGRDRIRRAPVSVLVAAEIVIPTIVSTTAGGPSPSRVTAWVDDGGRLLRAEVRLRASAPRAERYDPVVRVEFVPHAELGILVPAEMHEQFWSDDRRPGKGVATYTDFRRFQTSARILPQ